MGESLAVPVMNLTFLGIGGISPKGGFNNEMSGIGMGIGIFVKRFWIKSTGSSLCSASKEKLNDSTLVNASMLVFSAGWGKPILRSGPQYATFIPGAGPEVMKN